MKKVFEKALHASREQLRKMDSANGWEHVLRDRVAEQMPHARTEVPIAEVKAKGTNGSAVGYIDIVDFKRSLGIELKVVRLPRLNATASNALYDIGQLSSDYWRLWAAKKLDSALLLVLLYGPLVTDLKKPAAIVREFRNRMYTDYQTSLHYSELKRQKLEPGRKLQIKAVEAMGLNLPCESGKGWFATVSEEFALISIPVK